MAVSTGTAITLGLATYKLGKEALIYFRQRAKTAEEMRQVQQLQDAFESLQADLDRLSRRDQYRRFKIGSAWVLVPRDAEEPACCPKCRDELGEPLPLQLLPVEFGDFGSHRCSTCDTNFCLE